MADNPLANLDSKKLREINKEAKVMAANFDSIGKRLSQVAKTASKATGESFKGFTTSSSVVQQLNKNLSQLTKDSLKGLGKREAIEKDLVKLAEENAERTATIRNLQDDVSVKKAVLIDLEKELAKEISEGESADTKRISILEKQIESKRTEKNSTLDVLQVLQDQAEAASQVESQYESILDTTEEMERVNPFTGLSSVVKDIPIVNKLFGGLADAADRFNDELAESVSRTEALKKSLMDMPDIEGASGIGRFLEKLSGAKGIIPDLAKGFMGMAVGTAVDGFKRLDESSVALEKSLNMSTTEAINLQKSFIDTANSISGLTAEHLSKSLIEANEALGTTATMSMETLSTFATMTKQMGMTADQAGNLNKFALATGQNFKEFSTEAIGTVQILNAQNDTAIDYKSILKDVNNISNAVKLSTQAQGRNLAEAAYQAKKMGLSMGELDSIAGNLLEFEQSIANELEAELLLGKDLNLEKARAAALDGDLVTLGQELQKQGITQEKFSKMNRIEQESIAKAMGMSRESMADMFTEQSALNALSKAEGDNLNAKIKSELERIDAIENEEERVRELAALKEKVGNDELVDKQKAQTMAEKAMEAQIKMGDNLAAAMPTDAIVGMKDVMDDLNTNMAGLSKAVMFLAAVIAGVKIAGALAKFKRLRGGVKGIQNAGDDLAKGMKNSLDDVGKAAMNTTDDAAKAAANMTDDAMKAAANSTDDAVKAMAGGLDDVAAAGGRLGGIFKSFKGILGGALSSIKNLAKGIGEAIGKAGSLAKNLASAGGGAAGAASAMSGGASTTAKAATSAAKGGGAAASAAGDVAGTAGKAAKGGGSLFGKAFDFVKSGVSKVATGAKNMAGEALEAVNPMSYVKKFFKGGGGVSKLLKKLPGVGALIAPAIAAFEISQAAGAAADPRTVGSATLNALGGLGGGALGAVLGSLIPVPVVGTMLGGMAGDYIGRMVADLVSENVDMSGLGQMAINVFGGQTDTEGISPLMAEAGGTEETQIASDTASDFISRPGQPIQKFRPDDIVIGATNPMGGGSGDNARTVELLERLVAAVEKGGVINMDGNKVGTVLGMSSYRTQ